MIRMGFGYDSHKFAEGRRLVIGGVEIPFEKGLLGHSDADVLCHAIIDAILGAIGLGDIGRHFPDTDAEWQGASSINLLKYTVELCRQDGFKISWIDTTIIIEKPKLLPYIEDMKANIHDTGVPSGVVNIKAKTNEGMGFVGRGEGAAAYAVCVLEKL